MSVDYELAEHWELLGNCNFQTRIQSVWAELANYHISGKVTMMSLMILFLSQIGKVFIYCDNLVYWFHVEPLVMRKYKHPHLWKGLLF